MDTVENIVRRAYSVDELKKAAPQLIELIANQLNASVTQDHQPRTIDRLPPEEQLRFWQSDFSSPAPET